MPVLTKVEAKGIRGRMLHAGVFAALLVGGTTMVYPFLLMFSGALRSSMDESEMDLLPNFLTEKKVMVRKFLETKYNYDPIAMNRYRQTRDYSFRDAVIPSSVNEVSVADFKTFADSPDIPNHWHALGGTRFYQQMESVLLAELRKRVRERYNGDLNAVSADMGVPFRNWNQLELLMPDWSDPRFAYTPSALWEEYFKLVRERPVADRAYVNLTANFLEDVIYPEYSISDVEEYNKNHEVPIDSYESFRISRVVPPESQPTLRKEWLHYVLENCHVSFVRANASDAEYQAYLRQSFRSLERLNEQWASQYTSFEDITLPGDRAWVEAEQARAYSGFLEQLPPERLYLVGPEFAWTNFLKDNYESVDALNAAHGIQLEKWSDCHIPLADVETAYVFNNLRSLRWRFATRNFRIVANQAIFQGRPLFNTLVYVGLALLFSLTLQPLAAYSLSRFNPPGMWKFIFIFMATMAFPPMVATLPMFLMIKHLNLLNTFIALVLPVTINGFLIFMLKGFFDSIPQHLYEAAQIEGASEMYMFWRITMSLSKPILAVVALNTFRAAWMAFMYPLIVCPDEKMQVLAVWLHQFQQNAPTSAVFASILLASIPTLFIFIFAQKTIMKGIAVPAEK
ncbi:MAG: carbohydrate ABC transporter permease [Candidatus Pacebacteria bacterium]|nr:carbohydrate ABC transporter permease [Candidatus Paceibacterota bacterium]